MSETEQTLQVENQESKVEGREEKHDEPPSNEEEPAQETTENGDANGESQSVIKEEVHITQPTVEMSAADLKKLEQRRVELSPHGETVKKMHFFRKGDRYFKGSVWGVSPQKFCKFQTKLVELINLSGKEKANEKQELSEISSGVPILDSAENLSSSYSASLATKDFFANLSSKALIDESTAVRLSAAATKLSLVSKDHRVGLEGDGSTEVPASALVDETIIRNASTPAALSSRLVVIIRNGCKPRRIVRFMLSPQTAFSYDQVVTDMGDAVKSDVGTIKKVFGVDGVQITSLADFFKEEHSTFLISGPENPMPSDFELDPVERKWISQKKHLSLEIAGVASARRKIQTEKTKKAPRSALKDKSEIDIYQIDEYDELSDLPSNENVAASHFWLSYQLGELLFQNRYATTHFCTSKTKTFDFELLVKVLEVDKAQGIFENELKMLPKISHNNLIHACDQIYLASDFVFVIFENVTGFRLVRGITESGDYSEKKVAEIIGQVLQALVYLHDVLKVVHFNVNHNNLMITKNGTVVLGSYDKAVTLDELKSGQGAGKQANANLNYTAPEIAGTEVVSAKCDIYSVGILTLVLLTGRSDWVSTELTDSIENGSFSTPMKNFLNKTLASEEDRLSAAGTFELLNSLSSEFSSDKLDDQVMDSLKQLAGQEDAIKSASIVFQAQ